MPLHREHARIALAAIRLLNGTVAVLAPEMMLRRLGADPRANQVAVYPLRMFGIRTVVLGVELLAGGSMRDKGKVGVVIHAADAASAITAGLRRQLPPRVAALAAGISLTNTALALTIASEGINGGNGHAAPDRGHDPGARRRGAGSRTAPVAR